MERIQNKNLIPGKNRPVLHALTGKYRVVNADEPIRILVSEEDIEHAIPHDPRNCAIAESCRRQGAREAVIGASVAYVVTQDSTGEFVAVKYSVPVSTRKAIDRFDLSGHMPAKGFRLSRIKPSEMLGARAKSKGGGQPLPRSRRKPKKIELRNATGVVSLRNE